MNIAEGCGAQIRKVGAGHLLEEVRLIAFVEVQVQGVGTKDVMNFGCFWVCYYGAMYRVNTPSSRLCQLDAFNQRFGSQSSQSVFLLSYSHNVKLVQVPGKGNLVATMCAQYQAESWTFDC